VNDPAGLIRRVIRDSSLPLGLHSAIVGFNGLRVRRTTIFFGALFINDQRVAVEFNPA
jgi:hypothetical protein